MDSYNLVYKIILSDLSDEYKDADINVVSYSILSSFADEEIEVSWVAKINGIITDGSKRIHI